jgi:hypothetical protein
LDVTATSNNQALIRDEDIQLLIEDPTSPENRRVTIHPVENAHGEATIEMTVTDPGGKSSTQTFKITVTSVEDTPETESFTKYTTPGTPVVLDFEDFEFSDGDAGDKLEWVTITFAPNADNGALLLVNTTTGLPSNVRQGDRITRAQLLDEDFELRYVPSLRLEPSQSQQFAFTVSDGKLDSQPGYATMSIVPPGAPPTSGDTRTSKPY